MYYKYYEAGVSSDVSGLLYVSEPTEQNVPGLSAAISFLAFPLIKATGCEAYNTGFY